MSGIDGDWITYDYATRTFTIDKMKVPRIDENSFQ